MPDQRDQQLHPTGVLGAVSTVAAVLWNTVGAFFRYRVLGLAAETAFFGLLSLPPLLFGLAGSVGFIAQTFSYQSVQTFRNELLMLAGQFLTSDTIDSVIAPTLDEVLSAGRFDILSIGFLIALWSGSRAMAVFVDTVTIMYGRAGTRGLVHSRALSFLIYVTAIAATIVLIPLVMVGPRLLDRLLPDALSRLSALYWPIVLVGTLVLLTSLYNWAVPVRRRWRADVPGAALTLGLWLLFSWGLRGVLAQSATSSALYGPLAAPLALMLWIYFSSLATLIGAAFNAAIEKVFPELSGASRRRARTVLVDAPPTP